MEGMDVGAKPNRGGEDGNTDTGRVAGGGGGSKREHTAVDGDTSKVRGNEHVDDEDEELTGDALVAGIKEAKTIYADIEVHTYVSCICVCGMVMDVRLPPSPLVYDRLF